MFLIENVGGKREAPTYSVLTSTTVVLLEGGRHLDVSDQGFVPFVFHRIFQSQDDVRRRVFAQFFSIEKEVLMNMTSHCGETIRCVIHVLKVRLSPRQPWVVHLLLWHQSHLEKVPDTDGLPT